MLLVAIGGRAGMTALRPHAHRIRQALGVVVGLTALAIAFNVDRHFQTALPGYTQALQNKVEDSSQRAARSSQKLRGKHATGRGDDVTPRLRPGAAAHRAHELDQQQAADARNSSAARSC